MLSSERRAALAWGVTCALILGGCDGAAMDAPAYDAGGLADAGVSLGAVYECVAICTEASCGQPDGCGGVCPACPPACDCDGRVCGDDGCGGSCGSCAGAESCAEDGLRCDCGDASVTYRFSAPDVDWRTTARVVVTARQRFDVEAAATTEVVVLDRYHPSRELVVEGACEPAVEVRWEYVVAGRDALGRALHCDGDRWVLAGDTDIELPAGTGGACVPR